LQFLLQTSNLALTLLPSADLLCIKGRQGLIIACGLHRLLLGICSSSLCLMLQRNFVAFLCQYLPCTHSMSISGKCAEWTAKAVTMRVSHGASLYHALRASLRRPVSATGPTKERPSAPIRQGYSSVYKTRLQQRLQDKATAASIRQGYSSVYKTRLQQRLQNKAHTRQGFSRSHARDALVETFCTVG
jgi:hypothetical protein